MRCLVCVHARHNKWSIGGVNIGGYPVAESQTNQSATTLTLENRNCGWQSDTNTITEADVLRIPS